MGKHCFARSGNTQTLVSLIEWKATGGYSSAYPIKLEYKTSFSLKLLTAESFLPFLAWRTILLFSHEDSANWWSSLAEVSVGRKPPFKWNFFKYVLSSSVMSFRIVLCFKLISLLTRIQGYQIIFLLSQNFFLFLISQNFPLCSRGSGFSRICTPTHIVFNVMWLKLPWCIKTENVEP